jgi:hypothetical protein
VENLQCWRGGRTWLEFSLDGGLFAACLVAVALCYRRLRSPPSPPTTGAAATTAAEAAAAPAQLLRCAKDAKLRKFSLKYHLRVISIPTAILT